MGLCISNTTHSSPDDVINYSTELHHMFVITVLVNPARSRKAINIYNKFKKEIESVGARLVTVEYVCNGGPFGVTIPYYEPYNLQIRTDSCIFQKENLINMAVQQIPIDAKYVVWCDYEVEFLNPSWAYDVIKALKDHPIVQPFEEVAILDHVNKEISIEKSFAYFMANMPKDDKPGEKQNLPLFEAMIEGSGYAWAMNKEAFDDISGLLECCILGNGDKIMAYCLAQRAKELEQLHKISEGFMSEILSWQKKVKYVKEKIGFLPGKVNVAWTGVCRDRNVIEKWEILEKHEFDPKKDLKKNSEGVYYLCNEKKQELAQELKKLLEVINEEMYI